MSYLDDLNWEHVRAQYDTRETIHRRLLRLHGAGRVREFADLALGMAKPDGNYSAHDHRLGPQIIGASANARENVSDLAAEFMALSNGRQVPPIIRQYAIPYLKIGVGSELSCMVNPSVCWVANTRTIWTHLVFKHDDLDLANEELRLYRDDDLTSEMAYQKWRALHSDVVTSMRKAAMEGTQRAQTAGVAPGPIVFLWADAIANGVYDYHHG